MFEPITKRSKQIIRPDTVGEIVRLAFKHAEKGKPGATHIDLPQNIAKMPADAVPLKRQQMHDVYADPTHMRRRERSSARQRTRSSSRVRARCAAMPLPPSPSWPTGCISRWSIP